MNKTTVTLPKVLTMVRPRVFFSLTQPLTSASPRRHLSSSADSGLTATTVDASRPVPEPKTTTLPWNEYFKLRRRRRLAELSTMVPTTFIGLMGGGTYFLNKELDPTGTYLGLDPMIGYVVGIASLGFAGFLAGPILGNVFFKAMNRRVYDDMETKDRIFYQRVTKHRCDPSAQNFGPPGKSADYYGEKVKNLTDYRHWLRKQRELTRKSKFHIGEEPNAK